MTRRRPSGGRGEPEATPPASERRRVRGPGRARGRRRDARLNVSARRGRARHRPIAGGGDGGRVRRPRRLGRNRRGAGRGARGAGIGRRALFHRCRHAWRRQPMRRQPRGAPDQHGCRRRRKSRNRRAHFTNTSRFSSQPVRSHRLIEHRCRRDRQTAQPRAYSLQYSVDPTPRRTTVVPSTTVRASHANTRESARKRQIASLHVE